MVATNGGGSIGCGMDVYSDMGILSTQFVAGQGLKILSKGETNERINA